MGVELGAGEGVLERMNGRVVVGFGWGVRWGVEERDRKGLRQTLRARRGGGWGVEGRFLAVERGCVSFCVEDSEVATGGSI